MRELLGDDWRGLLDDGVDAPDLSGDACPACGATAPLVDGACSDCGLQLE